MSLTPTVLLFLTLVASLLFGWFAYRVHFLHGWGSVAGAAFAFSLLWLGGSAWAIPAVWFFLGSSLLSRIGKKRKAAAEEIAEKGSVRDVGQVLANGGVAWLLLLAHAAFPQPAFYWGFLGSLAAATADTWGTEIGTLFRGRPRLITTGRLVPSGTSGAISVPGTLGALAGAASVWAFAAPFAMANTPSAGGFFAITGAGFCGALIDSFVGATLQASYLDSRTGLPTEKPQDGSISNRLVSGYAWINNDRVNLVCTITGALIALLTVAVAQ